MRFESPNGSGLLGLRIDRDGPLPHLLTHATSVGVHDGWAYPAGGRDTALLFRDANGGLVLAVETPPPDWWADQAVDAGTVELRVGRTKRVVRVLPA